MKYSLQVTRSPTASASPRMSRLHTRPDGHDVADDIVTEHAWTRIRSQTLVGMDVGAADRGHPNAHEHLVRLPVRTGGTIRCRKGRSARRRSRDGLDGAGSMPRSSGAVDREVEDLMALERRRRCPRARTPRCSGWLSMKGTRASAVRHGFGVGRPSRFREVVLCPCRADHRAHVADHGDVALRDRAAVRNGDRSPSLVQRKGDSRQGLDKADDRLLGVALPPLHQTRTKPPKRAMVAARRHR